MPWPEMMVKDCKYALKSTRYFFINKGKIRKLFIYPHYPSSGSTMYKLAHYLNLNITNHYSSSADVVVYWEYLTFRKEFEFLESLQHQEIVNLHSRNIGKIYVDAAFAKIFGYATIINPTTFHGVCVKKNDINATHDGEIIQCPIEIAEPGYIYQILINNEAPNEQVMDIRVPVVGEVLDFIYLKYRSISERFVNSTTNTFKKPSVEVFSQQEISLINDFCKEIQLDFGELDILRNWDDGKIYIVDVNNTPQGPPANIGKQEYKQAVAGIADAFSKRFLHSK